VHFQTVTGGRGSFFVDARNDWIAFAILVRPRLLPHMGKRIFGFILSGCMAVAASAQVVVGFDSTRGGSYNLQSQPALASAIGAALPGATFSYTGSLDSGALTGAAGVVIVSPHDNSSPVTPLTTAEQAALSAFVLGGGFAIIITDSDYTPTNFDATNDSFLVPFGFSATGMMSTPITLTNPSANPIANGPFGLITSLTGIASGSFASTPTAFLPLGNNTDGTVAAGYFGPGALGAGSGAVLFLADGNVVNSGWATLANYNFISNFVAFAAVPEPATWVLCGVGVMFVAFVNRRRRPTGA